MAVVALIAFSLFNYVGDPVVSMVGQDATMEEKTRLRSELGLDQPVHLQYASWLSRFVQGDWGVSYITRDDIFKQQAPWFTIAHAVQLKPVRKEVVDFKLSPFGRHTFYGVDIKE